MSATSLHRWLVSSRDSNVSYLQQGDRGTSTEAANREVIDALEGSTANDRKRKRGEYHHYSAELRPSIAKYACECGNRAAVHKYSLEHGYPILEATVRNFKR